MARDTYIPPAKIVSTADGKIQLQQGTGILKTDTQAIVVTPVSEGGKVGDIQRAIDKASRQGGGNVFLKAGTYYPINDITLKSAVSIKGEKESTTVINFAGGPYSIKYEDDGVYSTGTITDITDGVVTGSGTSWLANVTPAMQLFIANRWYKIAAVTSDTTLILQEGYIGNANLPSSYRISRILTDVDLAELTVLASSSYGLNIRGGRNITKTNMTIVGNYIGFRWEYVTEDKNENVIVSTSISDGIQMENVGFGDNRGLFSGDNGGNGYTLNNLETMPFQYCATSANDGDGINATNVINSTFIVESKANVGSGIEFVAGCNDNFLTNCLVSFNQSDGIKLTATSDRNTISVSNFKVNVGYGINIVASTNDNTIIVGNQFVGNTTDEYNDSGTDTIIIQSSGGGGGAVDSVNGQTGTVVLDADDIDDTSTTNKFVTAGDLTNLSNLSGTNTGDQTLPVKATGAEIDTGTDDAKFATAKAIEDSSYIKATYADAKVADAINDGTTTIAPSQNAVFDALALKQPLDSDLTTIAGLTATTDNFLVANASAWASRTPSQARTHMGLGSLATLSAVDADSVTVSNLEVDNFKGSAIVTAAETIAANDNDTTIPTSAATQDAIDVAVLAAGSYTDEQAQDAIGTILADTATIDATYNDATPSIAFDVKSNSITPAMRNGGFFIGVIAAASLGSTGNLAVTGVGFTPKKVRFTILYPTSGSTSGHANGAMTTSAQFYNASSANGTNGFRFSSQAKCFGAISASTTPAVEAQYVSMDAGGFTVNVTTANTNYAVAYECEA